MDEPTVGADARRGGAPASSSSAGSRERGTTIVYVSHFLDEVLALADTVTVLRDGRRRAARAPAADETPAALVAAMLGRSVELTFPDKTPPPADAPVVLSRARALAPAGAFDDVSFEIRAGEIVGLAGLIGSGRSEVARAIFGADRRDAGDDRAGRASRSRPDAAATPSARGIVHAPGGPEGRRGC